MTIACVWVGEKYGAEYPAVLQDMVRRHVSPTRSLRFVCITDRPDELPAGMDAIEPEPGLPGWWQKLALFQPGKLPGDRIAYFDLDVVILNSLDVVLDRPGIIKEWARPGYNSSVMVWDAGDHADAWATLSPDDMTRLHSDQQKLDELGGWEVFPRHWCVSHRAESTFWPPYDAKIVVFHGNPKPHEFTSGWVPMAWKIGGLTGLPTSRGVNVPEATLLEHVRSACARDLIWFTGAPDNDRECCIVGGGPSLEASLPEIMLRVGDGAALVSLNGSLRWLLNRGLIPSSHVMLDARPENVEFIRDLPRETTMLVASQCHPAVFDALAGHPREKTILWHCGTSCEGFAEIVKEHAGEAGALIVGGGSTVGLRAMFLAFMSGFRKLHLYGFDSCISGEQHHAYAQPLNDGDTRIEVIMAGNRYVCAPWMGRQAQEFNWQHEVLTGEGCEVWAHGSGLLPDICRLRNLHAERRDAVDLELLDGVWYPLGEYVGPLRNPAEVSKVADILPLCRKREVAVQAGANVGLVPIELAKHFVRVVSFEPQPALVEASRRNMNGTRFDLIHAAVGDAPGVVGIAAVKGNCGAGQTRAGRDTIKVVTIDSLALPACDLIMLDIEGDEALALQGARQTIEAHRPVVVIEEKGLGDRHGWPKGTAEAWLAVTYGYRKVAELGRDVVLAPTE